MTEDDTETAEAPSPSRRGAGFAAGPYDVAEALAVVLALLVMFRVLSVAAGRDAGVISLGLLATAPAALLTRPWRRLPLWAVILTALVPVTALLICYVDPLQFAYTKDLTVWGYGPLLFLMAVGFARDAERRLLLVVAVCLMVVWSVVHGLQPWIGFHDPSRPIVGTFYWHNQMGTFSGVGALLGISMLVGPFGIVRLLGALTAVLGGVGLVLSTSRASLGLCVLGLVVILVVAASHRRWWPALAAVAVTATSVGVAVLLRALVTANGSSPTQAQVIGSTGERPLEANITARLHFWRAALAVFADHPVAGEGHGTFLLASPAHMPPNAGLSRWAHNGVLNAAADGGLVFGLPVAIATLVLLLFAVSTLRRSIAHSEDWTRTAAAVAVAVLVLHALVDFDWIYPILTGVLGLLAGVMVASSAGRSPQIGHFRSACAVSVLTVVVSGSIAYPVHVWYDQQAALAASNEAVAAGAYQQASRRLAAAKRPWVPNPELDAAVLTVAEAAARANRPLPARSVMAALAATARLGQVDPEIAQARVDAMHALRTAP